MSKYRELKPGEKAVPGQPYKMPDAAAKAYWQHREHQPLKQPLVPDSYHDLRNGHAEWVPQYALGHDDQNRVVITHDGPWPVAKPGQKPPKHGKVGP